MPKRNKQKYCRMTKSGNFNCIGSDKNCRRLSIRTYPDRKKTQINSGIPHIV